MSWTEEKVSKLKELWGKGNTASQIAQIIGGISRNAVIGKAHRLNLSAKIQDKNFSYNNVNLKKTEKVSQQKIKGDEKGSFAVPINKFLEIVTALTDKEVSLSVNDDFLIEINSKQGVYKITGKTPDDFPETPNPETTNSINVENKTFINIIHKIRVIFDPQRSDTPIGCI